MKTSVAIVGGGLAGLCCAKQLNAARVDFLLLEADDQVGGRVRTDEVDGFLLDRGFQVLLDSYPEAQRQLDLDALDLQSFTPGALVYQGGRLRPMIDPWRSPWRGLRSVFSSVGSFPDKLRVARLRSRAVSGALQKLARQGETTSLDLLRGAGFTDRMVEGFFRPFLGGIFLERELETSSSMLKFVFGMFATGNATLPAAGMGAIPAQLAAGLPSKSILCDARVASIDSDRAVLQDGREVHAEQVVVATSAPVAARLFGESSTPEMRSVTCVYFAAPAPPVQEPTLVLNGGAQGPINNLCVPSQVASSYAPEGQSLVSATVLGNPGMGDDQLESAVREQCREWFGSQVQDWRVLRTYRIEHALPCQRPPLLEQRPMARHGSGVFVCGDHTDTGSIQGAMISGRRAAEAVLASRG